ncbi:MAG: hypothetical protein IJF16_12100, partial [Clostridia bacterium]|nr:hypothetical protein [Clostridia bacterium]
MNRLLRSISLILVFSMIFSALPMTAFAQQESTICQLHHKEHTENCGYDETDPESVCAYISGCPECALEQEKSTEPAKTAVDFSDYLDSTMPIIFQSTDDIDLHDYFVGCGVDESITFTCSPEKVSFLDYSDGDLFNITLTATGDYEGSFDLEGEVRQVNSKINLNNPGSLIVTVVDDTTNARLAGKTFSIVGTGASHSNTSGNYTTDDGDFNQDHLGQIRFLGPEYIYSAELVFTFAGDADYEYKTVTISRTSDDWGNDTQKETIRLIPKRVVTVKLTNKHGQSITGATVKVGSTLLTDRGNGEYYAKCTNTTHTLQVSANGYTGVTETFELNSDITKEYTLECNPLVVKDGNTALTSETLLNIPGTESKTLTTDVPLDNNAALTTSVTTGNADGLGISVSGNNITITAKAVGEYKVTVTYTHGSNTESITFGVNVPKKQVDYPYTPYFSTNTFESSTVDVKSQVICFHGADSDIIHNVKITASGAVNKTQIFNNISGNKVTMQLSDTPVQGEVTYSFEFFSDSLEYVKGDKPGTISRTYMLSVPDVTISLDKNTYEYDGTNIKPKVANLDKDKYSLEYGYYCLINSLSYFHSASDFTKPTEFAKVSNYQVISYAVRAVGNKDNNYYSPEYKPAGIAYYTVTKRNITLTADDQTIDFYETLDQNKVTIGGSGLASGETLTYTLTPQPNPTSNGGTIAIDNIKIKRGTKDVTQYY